MAGTIRTSNQAGDSESALGAVRVKVEGHDALIKYLLIGIAASMLLFAVDMYQDRSTNDRLMNFAMDAADSREKMAGELEAAQQAAITTQADLTALKQCLNLGGWKTCFGK